MDRAGTGDEKGRHQWQLSLPNRQRSERGQPQKSTNLIYPQTGPTSLTTRRLYTLLSTVIGRQSSHIEEILEV